MLKIFPDNAIAGYIPLIYINPFHSTNIFQNPSENIWKPYIFRYCHGV